jgi:hypothetical protein
MVGSALDEKLGLRIPVDVRELRLQAPRGRGPGLSEGRPRPAQESQRVVVLNGELADAVVIRVDVGHDHARFRAHLGATETLLRQHTERDRGRPRLQYTLQVDLNGAGLIKVTLGWVSFEGYGRESFIPDGAIGTTRPGAGPGRRI